MTRLLLCLVRLVHGAGCKIEIGPLQRPEGSLFYIPSLFWGLAQPRMQPLVLILPVEAIVSLSLFPQFLASGCVFALLKRGDAIAAGTTYAFVMYATVFLSARIRHSLTLDISMLLMVVLSVRVGLAIGGAVRDSAALQPAVRRLQENLVYSRPSVRGGYTNS